ncbi:MAG: restriction endonuclease subunit S, partial [Gluconobacter oxydans]
LKTYKIIDPGIKIIRKFFEFIVPILDAKMSKESLNLAQLRDLLLPKLMSGAIRIHDAEKMVQDAL